RPGHCDGQTLHYSRKRTATAEVLSLVAPAAATALAPSPASTSGSEACGDVNAAASAASSRLPHRPSVQASRTSPGLIGWRRLTLISGSKDSPPRQDSTKLRIGCVCHC